MLVAFGGQNYLSFKEGFEVSAEYTSSCPTTISGGETYSPVLCLIGANASGKTNVLRALTFITDFCLNSFNYKPESPFMIAPFGSQKDPSYFFVEFMVHGFHYNYEVELSGMEVISEKLERKAARRVPLFSRTRNTLDYCVGEMKALTKIKMRKNASLISTSHQYGLVELEEVYAFFNSVKSNISVIDGGLATSLRPEDIFEISKYYRESKETFDFVKDKLAQADTGISDINIIPLHAMGGTEMYYPEFVHTSEAGNIRVPFLNESTGTRALYSQLSLFKQVLDEGGVLILDEFDNNLHPDLHTWLINLFLDPQNNPNKAQIIFSSHNTALMDRLSKYRVFLVNKVDNESFLYRLDELPGGVVRNDRSIENVYKTGKLGGVPRLGELRKV